MDDLDLTGLTDDQLVNLFRGCLREAGSRHPALRAAVEAAGLDEQERLRIIKEAGDREAAKLRAQERERLAREAAAQVQAAHAERETEISRARNQAAAAEMSAKVAAQQAEISRVADQWRACLDMDEEFIIVLYNGRLLVNRGDDRYAREHLVDWKIGTTEISTSRALISKKPQIVALAVEYCATYKNNLICRARKKTAAAA